MILDAAVEFFAEHGLKAQTRELANQIGVSQALIFRYFGTKEALLERVYESTFLSRWDPAWESILANRDRPLRERLKAFYRSYIAAIDDRRWIRIAMQSSLEGSDLTQRYIQNVVTNILNVIALELQAEACDLPALEASSRVELVWHLHSSIIYFLVRKHIHGTGVSIEADRLADIIVDNFLDGYLHQGRGRNPEG